MGAIVVIGLIVAAVFLTQTASGQALITKLQNTTATAVATVPVPSDASLLQKYGLTNPAHNIAAMSQDSLTYLRIAYVLSKYTPSCQTSSLNVGPSGAAIAGASVGIATQLTTEIGDTASTSATGLVGALGSASNVIPIVGQAASVIIGVITSIFNAHAQAVAREQSTLCAAANAFNTTMAQIDANVANGNLALSQLVMAYVALLTQFEAWVKPVASGCGINQGNEACVLIDVARAVCEKRAAQLNVAQSFLPGAVPGLA